MTSLSILFVMWVLSALSLLNFVVLIGWQERAWLSQVRQTSLFGWSEIRGSKFVDPCLLVGQSLAVPSSPILVNRRVGAWWFEVHIPHRLACRS